MKKLLAGCLVVAVLGGVALVVAAYFGYRAARPMIDGAATLAQQAREMAAASERIENKAPFDAPATGELKEDQVRRYLAVHQRVRTSLGPKWSDLESRARALEARARDSRRDLSLSEMGTMLSELGNLLMEARRAHVDALNAEGFSSGEYSWTRLRIYEAAGIELMGSVDWSGIEGLVKQGADQAGVDPPELKLPEIPEANRALIKPHADALQQWLPLAMLGF